MSFREKSAWIFLISMLLVAGFFFLHVPWALNPSPSPRLVRGLLYCFIALVVIEVVAHIVVAIRAPEDAPGPRDEREHLIDLKATRLAHYVYVVGCGILFAFVIGEVAKNAARIVYHRRGI